MVVITGALIVIGLILSVVGEQIIQEGFNRENGKISLDQTLTISSYFNMKETPIGIFSVQVMEFKDNIFSARVLDPFDIEIISQTINEETVEKEFDVFETGDYKLIIESTGNEETQILGVIGPFPDAIKLSLRPISMIILVTGMVGLVIVGIYAVKNRRRSV